ncbi:MAG: hypothetical protein M3P93_10725 [Actinomycetota bacterium]|nr:hypothetical protein [Actinomycetota bacterium]
MDRIAWFVLRHRLLVVLGWAVVLVAGLALSQRAVDRLVFDFSLPGQPGYETEQELVDRYGSGPDEGTAVVRSPHRAAPSPSSGRRSTRCSAASSSSSRSTGWSGRGTRASSVSPRTTAARRTASSTAAA